MDSTCRLAQTTNFLCIITIFLVFESIWYSGFYCHCPVLTGNWNLDSFDFIKLFEAPRVALISEVSSNCDIIVPSYRRLSSTKPLLTHFFFFSFFEKFNTLFIITEMKKYSPFTSTSFEIFQELLHVTDSDVMCAFVCVVIGVRA